jgi:predicted acetyltransferase
MSLVLRKLNLNDHKAFLEGLDLFKDMEPSWYSFLWEEGMSFNDHIKLLEERASGVNIPEGRVPDSMLYAFLDNKIIGRSSIRHELNEFLFNVGGHIGYAVATPFRKRGYATEILKQSLIYCKNELQLEKVLLTCDDDNIGSFLVIEKNGGELESRFVSEDGTIIKRRYWIKL